MSLGTKAHVKPPTRSPLYLEKAQAMGSSVKEAELSADTAPIWNLLSEGEAET